MAQKHYARLVSSQRIAEENKAIDEFHDKILGGPKPGSFDIATKLPELTNNMEKITAVQYFEKYVANQETALAFQAKFGIPFWKDFSEMYRHMAKVSLVTYLPIDTSYIEKTLNGLTIVPKNQIPKIIEYCHTTHQLYLMEKSLGPTFKLNPSEITLPFTYVNNWDYIQNVTDDESSKKMLLNFINSVLYRGENLWMFDLESAISLVAHRNCSDEAQNILDKGMK